MSEEDWERVKPTDDKQVFAKGVESKAKAFEALQHIVTWIVTTPGLDLEELFDLLLSEALELTHSRYGTLQLYRRRSKDLEMVAQRGASEAAKHFTQKLGEGVVGRVASEMKPYRIDDISKCSYYVKFIPGMKSELAVPLIFRDNLLGVLNVESNRLAEYHEHDEEILSAFGSQMALAITLADVLRSSDKELHDTITELEKLRQIGEAIAAELDLNAVLDLILDSGIALVGKRKGKRVQGTIQLVGRRTEDLIAVAHRGTPTDWISKRIKIGERGITGLVAASKNIIIVPDIMEEPWAELYIPLFPSTRSEITVPMIDRNREKVVGIINLESDEVEAFSTLDEPMLTDLARLATIALQNARRYLTLKEVQIVAEGLKNCHDIGEVLELGLHAVVEFAEAHSGSIRLLHEDTGQLIPVIRRGEETHMSWSPISIGKGIVGLAVDRGEIIHVGDVNRFNEYLPFNPSTRSEIAVPLKRGENIFGVINLEQHFPDAFDSSDLNFVESIAGEIVSCLSLIEYEKEIEARKAVSWLGVIESTWKHTVVQYGAAIRTDANRLNKYGECRDLARRISNNAQHMLDLLPQLPSGDVKEHVQINNLIHRIGQRMGEEYPNIQPIFELDDSLPEIQASVGWLEVVFDNLVSNSVRAMDGSGKLQIITLRKPSRIEIEIIDEGHGIPIDIYDGLQDDKPVHSVHGMGVGFLLARTVVANYGGMIDIKQTGPGGTTTVVKLPLTRDEQPLRLAEAMIKELKSEKE